jgi:hypothetical protein
MTHRANLLFGHQKLRKQVITSGICPQRRSFSGRDAPEIDEFRCPR